MSDKSDDDTERTCPICGQGYDHKREERIMDEPAKLRTDATACKTSRMGARRFVYIHIRGEA